MLLLLATTMLLLVGCLRVESQTEVYGVYELRKGAHLITLEIRRDGTFEETIVRSAEKIVRREGKWAWRADSLNIESLWIPPIFAPTYVLTADARASSNEFRYTEPGNWFLSVEKQFGTVVLVVFPDDDINFRMIRKYS